MDGKRTVRARKGGRRRRRRRSPWKWALLAVVLLVVAGVTPFVPANAPTVHKKATQPVSRPVEVLPKEPQVPDQEEPTQQTEDKSEEEQPAQTVETVVSSRLVGESDAVDPSYFDDAVFIGDSRMEGFKLYSGLDNAMYLTSVGATVDTVANKATERLSSGAKVPIMDALAQKSFSKVYLMLGMNELGWVYPDLYIKHYGALIDRIREIQPDAVIYIESIMPVTKTKDDEGGYINNERINQYNQLLMQLAEDKEVWYLDVSQAVEDESGRLPEAISFDGVHLKPEGCKTWLTYLTTHTAP